MLPQIVPRVYIDTSVIGGCFDAEFDIWSKLLFEEFHKGIKIAVISDLTRRELKDAPPDIRKILSTIPDANLYNVFLSKEAERLALSYFENKVVTSKHLADAQHIAIATVERVDVLVSWNFKQIVNLEHIHAFNSINIKLGYPVLEIRSPREVIHEKKI
ncbi:MAG: PIN domain protein [bacterium]